MHPSPAIYPSAFLAERQPVLFDHGKYELIVGHYIPTKSVLLFDSTSENVQLDIPGPSRRIIE